MALNFGRTTQPIAPPVTGPSVPGGFFNPDPATKARIDANPAVPANEQDPLNRDYIRARLTDYYKTLGLTPSARGSGSTDIEYYIDQVLATGGWTAKNAKGENNIGYWQGRIAADAGKGGSGSAGGMSPSPSVNPAQMYQLAVAAANRQRAKSVGAGRQSTMFANFSATRPTTAGPQLGGY